jgi:hypothetical protein
MNPQLNHRVANEHIADLRRDAKRQQDAQVARHESFVVRVMAQLWRERPGRPPARPRDAERTTRATDAATAEA